MSLIVAFSPDDRLIDCWVSRRYTTHDATQFPISLCIFSIFSPPNLIMSPPHCACTCAFKATALATCRAATAADGRRAQTAGRRYVIAYQTVPPTPPDATTSALLPSRNQRPRRLSAFCWQDAACMERRCRSSAVQAEQAIGYVNTWHQRLC